MVVPVLSFPDQPGEIVRAIEHRIEAEGVACRGNDRCHHRPGKVDGPEARIEPLDPAALHLVFGFGEPIAHAQASARSRARRTARATCCPVFTMSGRPPPDADATLPVLLTEGPPVPPIVSPPLVRQSCRDTVFQPV